MNDSLSPANAAEAARHVHGSTIAWGDTYLDLARPDEITVELDDYAYCLAYTVRWRGQCRVRSGSGPNSERRPFYGVGQHCVIGARHMLREGHGPANAAAFLFHESDEVPFGDFPGPAKVLMPDAVALAKRIGASINRGFGIETPDPDLLKRFDIRMLVTEKRDLLHARFGNDSWSHDGEGDCTSGYEPFADRIVPYSNPEEAAVDFLELAFHLGIGR